MKPFYESDAGVLYCGDCLEMLGGIADSSIDMILCDLPYGTTDCKWDICIPLEPLWAHYKRIIKTNGAIVLTASQPFTSALVMSNLGMFKYAWVWVKNLKTGNLYARHRPMGGHEDITVFYKNPPQYNPQKRRRTTEVKAGNKLNSTTSVYGKQRFKYLDRQSDLIHPDTVLTGIKCAHNGSGKLHPTQKPVALFEYLIRTYTCKGDLVLDNCAGSGTTAIACYNTSRRYILIEKDHEYCKVAAKRIEAETRQLKLFG